MNIKNRGRGCNVKYLKLLLKLSVFTSILLVAACGQKGPLFLDDGSEKVGQSKVNK